MSTSADVIYSSKIFGEFSPYLYTKDEEAVIAQSMSEAIIGLADNSLELDIASVLSLLNFNYILGDRTLIKNISRIPWHSDVKRDGQVIRNPPLPHDSIVLSEEEIALTMCSLLTEYLELEVLSKHKTIWLTLSGGYDSRIIAGILHRVNKPENTIKVLNWGLEDSLDVTYAKKIAENYQWEYVHVPFYDGYIEDIISVSSYEFGAELSPLDYSPLETNTRLLNKISSEDAIIFAHYGDGIGRGLYQGCHFSQITPRRIRNPYFLFNRKLYKHYRTIAEDDRSLAWKKDLSSSSVKKVAINELDMHENYMRRMLTKRFPYCEKHDPFTSSKLVEFVYSLSADCRNSKVYELLLGQLDESLVELPYANTGMSFSGNAEKNKRLKKNAHNKYSDFLKLYDKASELLKNGQLVERNIINRGAIQSLFDAWVKDPGLSSLVSRLYCIELFIQKFNVEVAQQETIWLSDNFSRVGGRTYASIRAVKKFLG